jgi:Holliday junction resolvase RusA-like endonuclease
MKIKITIEGRPMSKSNEHRSFRGRPYLSEEFKRYERNAAWQAHQQMRENNWKMFIEPIFVTMIFYFKDHTRLDLGNCPKSICDGLNKMIWKDDRIIHKMYLEHRIDARERIEIEAWNIAESQEHLPF